MQKASFFSGTAMGRIAFACLIGATVVASPAQAQDGEQGANAGGEGLEEIVVTAQHRRENLQDVPISVTAITGAALEAGGISGLTEIYQAVPSVQLTRSGPAAQFFVRGVGNSSGGTGEEGANAFYVDGVYLGDLAQVTMEFNNIERVEVLKGPQGTLFGRNASGGLVNVITRDPGDILVVKAKAGYGNYATKTGQFYVASPLSDSVSADFALTAKDQANGFGKNLATGKDVQLGWNYGVRSKLVWHAGADTKVTLSADYRRNREDYMSGFSLPEGSFATGGFGYVGDYNINSVDVGYQRLKIWGMALTVQHDLDWANFTSVTGYRNLKSLSVLDGDRTPIRSSRVSVDSGNETFQQEFRLASADTKPLSWQAGLFYYRGTAQVFSQETLGLALGGIDSGSDAKASQKTTSYAAFGEVSYDLTDTTHATVGLRYTKDKRSLRASQVAVNQIPSRVPAFTIAPLTQSASFDEFTYRFAVRQDLSRDINIYASYNRGFKSGLFSLQSPTAPGVKPQTIDAFEVGFKSELFDRKLRFNLAAFHYDIKGYQVRSSIGLGAGARLLNAASVKVDGVEAEMQLAPMEGLNISANATYLNSRFKSFPNNLNYYPRPAVCNPVGTIPAGMATGPATGGNLECVGSASGNRTPLAPKFAASLSARYTVPLGEERELILTGLLNYTSKVHFEADNRLAQNGYAIYNGSIEYRPNARWGFELWAKNLFDKQYYIQKVGSPGGDKGDLAAPRTYGVSIKVDW